MSQSPKSLSLPRKENPNLRKLGHLLKVFQKTSGWTHTQARRKLTWKPNPASEATRICWFIETFDKQHRLPDTVQAYLHPSLCGRGEHFHFSDGGKLRLPRAKPLSQGTQFGSKELSQTRTQMASYKPRAWLRTDFSLEKTLMANASSLSCPWESPWTVMGPQQFCQEHTPTLLPAPAWCLRR